MSFPTELVINIAAYDNASKALATVDNAVKQLGESASRTSSSLGTFNAAQRTVGATAKDLGVAVSGTVTSFYALYNLFDRLQWSTYTLNRAQNRLEDSQRAVLRAQNNLNEAIIEFGAGSEEAQAATEDLAYRMDDLKVAQEHVQLMQQQINEQWIMTGALVIPMAITAVSSLDNVLRTTGVSAAGLSGAAATLSSSLAVIVPVIIAIIAVITTLYLWWDDLAKAWSTLVAPALTELDTSLRRLGEALGTNIDIWSVLRAVTFPIYLFLLGLIGVFDFLIKSVTGWSMAITIIIPILRSWGEAIWGAFDTLARFLSGAVEAVVSFFLDLGTGFTRFAGDVVSWWSEAWRALTSIPFVSAIIRAVSDLATGIYNTFIAPLKGVYDFVVMLLDAIRGVIIALTGITAPATPTLTAAPVVPHLQHGGLVTQPTLALLAEAGPELIIPEYKMAGFVSEALKIAPTTSTYRGGDIIINLTVDGNFVGGEQTAREVAKIIAREVRRYGA